MREGWVDRQADCCRRRDEGVESEKDCAEQNQAVLRNHLGLREDGKKKKKRCGEYF